MSFEIRVNGEAVKTFDERVDRVAVQTGRGTVTEFGLSVDDGVIDLITTSATAGGPLRLETIDEERAAAERERREGEDKLAGVNPVQEASRSLNTTQNADVTVPEKDLAEGLDRTNYDNEDDFIAARTQAVEEFTSGDSTSTETTASASTETPTTGGTVPSAPGETVVSEGTSPGATPSPSDPIGAGSQTPAEDDLSEIERQKVQDMIDKDNEANLL